MGSAAGFASAFRAPIGGIYVYRRGIGDSLEH